MHQLAGTGLGEHGDTANLAKLLVELALLLLDLSLPLLELLRRRLAVDVVANGFPA